MLAECWSVWRTLSATTAQKASRGMWFAQPRTGRSHSTAAASIPNKAQATINVKGGVAQSQIGAKTIGTRVKYTVNDVRKCDT